MRTINSLSLFVLFSVVALNGSYAEEASKVPSATEPSVSTLHIMEEMITPATNTLWEADDPQTDEEWSALEDAASKALVASDLTAQGGNGPSDKEWAQAPAYQVFNSLMKDSIAAMLEAIRSRNADSLLDSGDALYSACEGCHLQFNPSVVNEQ